MKRAAPPAALVAAIALGLVSVVLFFVAAGTFADADGARDGAQRLLDARIAVAKAQERIGGSDLDEALVSARAANAAAEKVGRITGRVARLLESTRRSASTITSTSRRGTQTVLFTRRQTEAVSASLRAISRYQRNASHSADISNRALARILRALRRTNEEFPGR